MNTLACTNARRAAGGNHLKVMEYLLSKGAPVDQADKSGRTALHWAAISGHLQATEVSHSAALLLILLATAVVQFTHTHTQSSFKQ
jgi:ankyrin repeat protein